MPMGVGHQDHAENRIGMTLLTQLCCMFALAFLSAQMRVDLQHRRFIHLQIHAVVDP